MISLSTHILDSATGRHAAKLSVTLSAVIDDNKLIQMWNKFTDDGGRLKLQFTLEPQYQRCELQLSFNLADYFGQTSTGVQAKAVSLNISLPDPNGSYHLPIIISPRGASLWWSN